ncbi:MAG: acetoacetate decarboxylase family protein [Microthrixaceae bacterium]
MTETADPQADYWGDLDGVPIHFPVVVDDMNQLTLTYSVPLDAAQGLLPGDGFDVVETEPGKAMFVVSIVDYVTNPWGDYNEVNFGFIVSSRTDPEVSGAFVYRMPVNEEFTCKAGNQVMGLPKTVEDLTFDYVDGTVTVDLAMGGEATLKVTFPDEAPVMDASMTETLTFSYLGGGPTAIPLEIEIGGAMIDPDNITVELGGSAVADELRSLGLPDAQPDMALWGKGLRGTFQRPYSIG